MPWPELGFILLPKLTSSLPSRASCDARASQLSAELFSASSVFARVPSWPAGLTHTAWVVYN